MAHNQSEKCSFYHEMYNPLLWLVVYHSAPFFYLSEFCRPKNDNNLVIGQRTSKDDIALY